ncbi:MULTISPECIES: SRPBCC family protein [Arthrobacter]|uniref:SRPBCC family protein n=2 Tax=Arthrobacter TaxID=1663 RepID=A0ABU9KHD9_9MICC|nr:SRPBCC family protein [Arthrobacter sp. YJM1]MDP5225976.1 SRPBCC family protein [Arthrobacter sp. YJM1]
MSKTVSASNSIVIAKPVEEVFVFFADAENDPKWRTGVQSIERQGDLAVGVEYRQTVSGPGGRAIPADVRVTAYDPPNRVGFEGIAGPVRPRGEYRVESTDGGARVTFSLSAELGGLKAVVMAGMVQKTMDSEVAGLSKAKTVLEGS